MTTTAQHARHAFELLLDGHPNGATPEELGDWWQAYDLVKQTFDQQGHQAAVESFNVILRSSQGKGLARLLAGAEPVKPASPDAMPALPEAARAIERHEAPCAGWLHSYVDHACLAAPMTPRVFHEAAGLAAASTAIARRVVLPVGAKKFFTNLYMMILAPSTLWHKSSGLEVLEQLLDRAGLAARGLPKRVSPEALAQELSTSIPSTYWTWDQTIKDEWLQMRPFAAQRLWLIDEAADLFDKAKRDVYAGLLNLLLELYDCKDRMAEQMIGRGRTIIQNAHITFLGASTPSAMAAHLAMRRFWTDGQWARFVLLLPDGKPSWKFFTDQLDMPSSIPAGLQRVNALFPAPTAEIVDSPDDATGKSKTVALYGASYQSTASLAPGVWQAWEAYARAVGHDLLLSGQVPSELHPNYGRMGTRLIKVAMILATLDAERLPVVVELRHLAAAQRLLEQWRAMLHRVWSEGVQIEEAEITDKILALLSKAGATGMVARDIYRPLHLASKETRELLEEMERSGMVERLQPAGKAAEIWRLPVQK